jgi:hypothetical protein
MPNFAFSRAVAQFWLEREKKAKIGEEASPELLCKAIAMFPNLWRALMHKADISIIEEHQNIVDLAFFESGFCPPVVSHLQSLYVERCFALFKVPEMQDWLKSTTKRVLALSQQQHPLIAECRRLVEQSFTESEHHIFRHIVLSEYTDQLQQLPDDIAEGLRQEMAQQGVAPQVLFHGRNRVAAPPQTRLEVPQGANPLALFLQTLLQPWNYYRDDEPE